MEAQEREEQSAGRAIKLVKGKVGKPKAKKMNLEETMPSPFGRRVDPPTQTVKSESAKKLTKKKKVSALCSLTHRCILFDRGLKDQEGSFFTARTLFSG